MAFACFSSAKRVIPVAVLSLLWPAAHIAAQTAAAPVAPQEPITVTARPAPVFEPQQSELGLAAPAAAPQSITVFTDDLLREAGAKSLSQALRLDASLGDFYNTTGYIESLQVRGFVLATRNNFLRNGLPVSNYTPFALENKTQVEVLKGTSGLQAGVSAPGGLIDYALKRPTAEPLRSVVLGASGRGGAYAHADIGGRAGDGGAFGYRINLAAEQLRPEVRNADGERQFASGFFDLRMSSRTLIEAEFELARRSQPSVPGFGLLDTQGNGVAATLPAPVDPRINLNNQPWSQPFVSRSLIGSLALKQALGDDWRFTLRGERQQVRTDDRIAFPDGCSSGPTYVYPGFCGTAGHVQDFDLYDYRSNDERRALTALNAELQGRMRTGALTHRLTLGWLKTRYDEALPPYQTYNFVGTGNVYTTPAFAPAPEALAPNTQRQERSDEFYASDALALDAQWTLYAGLRHTRLERASQVTGDANTTRYAQRFTAPFAGLSAQLQPGLSAYASWGEGIESEVVPNRPQDFDNPGVALPALKSRQTELGLKWQATPRLLASAALFDIRKPYADNLPGDGGLLHREAGARLVRHRGLELAAAGKLGRDLNLMASLMALDARIMRNLADAALEGKRVTNVPRLAASLFADHALPAVNGAALNAKLTYAGSKAVTADNGVALPASWQLDLGARLVQRWGEQRVTWRLQVENLLDRRYWRDAPTQAWGGIYLFPAAPRTLSATVQIDG